MTPIEQKRSLGPEDGDILRQRSGGATRPAQNGSPGDTLRRRLRRLSAKHYSRRERALRRIAAYDSYSDPNNIHASEARAVVTRKHRLLYEAERLELIRQWDKGVNPSTCH